MKGKKFKIGDRVKPKAPKQSFKPSAVILARELVYDPPDSLSSEFKRLALKLARRVIKEDRDIKKLYTELTANKKR